MKQAIAKPKAKYGLMKEVVIFAQMNGMPAKTASRHFNVNVNSLYWAARRMGVTLPKRK